VTRFFSSKKIIILLCFFILISVSAFASTVTLAWDAVDGGQDGFRLYWGKESHVSTTEATDGSAAPYASMTAIPDGTVRQISIPLPDSGKYFFRILAYKNESGSSVFSNELTVDIPESVVDVPTNFHIVDMVFSITNKITLEPVSR
jgi:hypothetical protein